MSSPAVGLRPQYADFNASQTSSAFMRSLIDQPTMRRLARSITAAVDCGTPSLLAAALPPIGSANRVASTLNSSVYCRFLPTPSCPSHSFVHQNINKLPMYVKPGQGHTGAARNVLDDRLAMHAGTGRRRAQAAGCIRSLLDECHELLATPSPVMSPVMSPALASLAQ